MAKIVGVVDGSWNNHRCGGGDGTPTSVYHPGANLLSEGFILQVGEKHSQLQKLCFRYNGQFIFGVGQVLEMDG